MHGPTEQWVLHLLGGNHKEMEQKTFGTKYPDSYV